MVSAINPFEMGGDLSGALGQTSVALGWSPESEAGWEELMLLQFHPEACGSGEPPPWWSAIGLTADYLGRCAARVTGGAPTFEADFSRLANELLENAFKYRLPGQAEPVSVSLHRGGGGLALKVSQQAARDRAERLLAALREAFRNDFPTQLEGASEESAGGGLGLWMLAQEPGVRLGWRFDPLGETRVRVTAWLSLGE